MPRQYSMGGRATPGMIVGGGAGPAGAPPRSLRERFGALRNLPPFLWLVWRTSRGLTAADLACRLARAFLPVVTPHSWLASAFVHP